ncbi:hypothetical protein GGR57DRAFT_481667, partial [Xylariaceae sp. FL1272]
MPSTTGNAFKSPAITGITGTTGTTAVTSSPPVTVIVGPSVVAIDNSTFVDNPTQPTSTVIVDNHTYTLKPTAIISVDLTITRPASGQGAVTEPTPTHTTIGGLSVDVAGSSVDIDGTTLIIGPKPVTVTIQGQAITLGSGGIVFPNQTLIIPAPQPTTQVVVGAELITAIGTNQVIIEGSTITYGKDSTTGTRVIDGDTILIGPSGVIVHGETYGGPNAVATGTSYAMVGGATISQVGDTAVVIQGTTYSINPLIPGQATATATMGGETITIGPEGVVVSTLTVATPYASTTIITAEPSNSAATQQVPSSTAKVISGDDGNGSSATAASTRSGAALCTAFLLQLVILCV